MIASLLWASSGSFYQNKHRGLKKRNGVFYLSKRNQIVNSMCTNYESQITTFPINEFIKLLNFIVISCHVGKNPNNYIRYFTLIFAISSYYSEIERRFLIEFKISYNQIIFNYSLRTSFHIHHYNNHVSMNCGLGVLDRDLFAKPIHLYM